MFCNVGGVSRDCVNMGTVVDTDVVAVFCYPRCFWFLFSVCVLAVVNSL